jgi:hypothetical protein
VTNNLEFRIVSKNLRVKYFKDYEPRDSFEINQQLSSLPCYSRLDTPSMVIEMADTAGVPTYALGM